MKELTESMPVNVILTLTGIVHLRIKNVTVQVLKNTTVIMIDPRVQLRKRVTDITETHILIGLMIYANAIVKILGMARI